MPRKRPIPVRARPEPRHRPVLQLLLQAWDYAVQAGVDPWEFAEEVADLRAVGASHTDLRWLLENGWIDHAVEIASYHGRRRFRKVRGLSLPRNSAFVLTAAGKDLARQLDTPSEPHPAPLVPRFDVEHRELWFGPHLVKRFRRPAANQELILTAFEEEAWSARIDDPLPVKPGRDSKQCLHDAINHLNRNQVNPVLRFAGDGRGKGIYWHQNGTGLALDEPPPLPTLEDGFGSVVLRIR